MSIICCMVYLLAQPLRPTLLRIGWMWPTLHSTNDIPSLRISYRAKLA